MKLHFLEKFKNLNYSKLKNISLHSQKISEHSALIAKKNNVRLILKNYQKKFQRSIKIVVLKVEIYQLKYYLIQM